MRGHERQRPEERECRQCLVPQGAGSGKVCLHGTPGDSEGRAFNRCGSTSSLMDKGGVCGEVGDTGMGPVLGTTQA